MKDISIIQKKLQTILSIFAEMRASVFAFFTVILKFPVRDSSSPWLSSINEILNDTKPMNRINP